MTALRVGLIGLGQVGRVHLDAYQSSNEVEVVAVADIVEEPLRAVATKFGLRAYVDFNEMLATESLDIACVLTPAAFHLAVVKGCADAGVAVLCEKPLSINVEAGRTLVNACGISNAPLCYGASYRYLPALVTARNLIESGAIGTVRSLRETYIGGGGPERQRELGSAHYPTGLPGGTPMGLVDHGVHLIDAMAWLMNNRITSAIGRGNRTGEPLAPEYAVLHFANGATGWLSYDDGTFPTSLPTEGIFGWGSGWDLDGYVPPGRWQAQPGFIDVHGDRGALRIYHYANQLFMTTANGVSQISLSPMAAPMHFCAQIDAFALALRTGASSPVPGEDGLRALMVLDTIYRSGATRVVDVPESLGLATMPS